MSSTAPTTATMKAVVQTGYDDAFEKVLELAATHPKPNADGKKNQVRIRVMFAATNPVDHRYIRGDLSDLLKLDLPVPIGRDFAGYIDDIPDGCKNPANLKVGDRICGWLDHTNTSCGAMSEFLVCNINVCAKIPDGMEFEHAVCLPLAGNTTYFALVKIFKMKPNCGKKIVILGGSGATGSLGIQMARHFGCTEIAVTSTNEELCKSLGATRVINYNEEKWYEVLRGQEFDFVYDTVGGKESYEQSAAVLSKKNGMFYTIVGDITSGKLTIGRLLGAICGSCCRGCCSGPKYLRSPPLDPKADNGLEFWLELVSRGNAQVVRDPHPPYEFSAKDAVEMVTKQASGRCKGKLVMKIA